MGLTKLQFAPGVDKDDSPLSTEGGWTDADKVRFVRGRPQTIGGWDQLTSDTFSGIARGAHSWGDVLGHRFLAWGTATKLYAYLGGSIVDITPYFDEGVLVDVISTTNGSAVVGIHHVGHGLQTGQIVTFSNQDTAVGSITLSGAYTVTVLGVDDYTVTAGSNATASVPGGAGGNIDFAYAMVDGLVDGVGTPGGYGGGAYGSGGYGGTITSSATQPRTWSLDNFGSSLVAVPRGGPLFEYQPYVGIIPEMVTNGDFATTAGWTLGAGWSIGAGVLTGAAGATSEASLPIVIEEGAVYRVTFTVTRTAGSTQFKCDGLPFTGFASYVISKSGTYSRLFRATPGMTKVIFAKDAAFVGTIDTVSVKLASTAYRIREAPVANEGMFVDPNGIVVLYGTSAYLDTYNPLAVRWSDLQNISVWTPTTANLAGDAILSTGARIVSGKVARTQNLLWTDVGIYTMQFTGDASEPFLFRLAGTGCGAVGPLATCENNGVVYWASKDNFFRFQGVAPEPIPSSLRRDFFENVSDGQQEKMVVGPNAAFGEIWYFYPDARDGVEVSRYAAYQYEENHWTCGTFNRTSWVGSGVYETPVAFGTDGKVYLHERGDTASGAILSSFVEASYFDVQDGERLTHIRRIVPDFEGQSGPVNFDVYYKRFPNAAEVFKGSYTAATNTEKIDLRVTARQLKFKLSAAAAPSFWRLGALRLDILPTGQTR